MITGATFDTQLQFGKAPCDYEGVRTFFTLRSPLSALLSIFCDCCKLFKNAASCLKSHSPLAFQYVNVEPIEYISMTQRSVLISIRNLVPLSPKERKYNLYALEFCCVCMCAFTTVYNQHFHTVEYTYNQNPFLHLFITM